MEPQPFIHVHRVTYADCTLGDHVYYGRYLDLLEAARGEFMRALGHPLRGLQEQDIVFPVVEATLRYKAMARYDDVLHIEVVPLEVERVRLTVGCRVTRPADGKLILEAETRHVCASAGEKPRRIPEEVAANLKALLTTASAPTA